MKGKILGAGAISAVDGGRYYYDEGEIKNAKDGQKIEGCEVDFDIKDGKAVMIYITKGSGFSANFGGGGTTTSANLPKFDMPHIFLDLGCGVANLFKVNMHSAKIWFLVLALLNIFVAFTIAPSGNGTEGFVKVMFWIISIFSIALAFWVSFCMGTMSQNYKLLLYLAILLVSSIIFAVLLGKILTAYMFALFGMAKTPYIKITFAIIFAVVMLFCSFKYLSLLSRITAERAYLWSFFAAIGLTILEVVILFAAYNKRNPLDTLDTMQVCNVIIYFVSMGLFVWATLRFREIKSVA